MTASTYLVFGDLHGRILPAFRLASVWAREHATPLAGLLQVGDLGFFPDSARLDRATKRHAEKDALELGARDVVAPTKLADQVFADPDAPPALYFTLGNHEDYGILADLASGGDDVCFPVDHYLRVHCIRDGKVLTLPDGLRVGALWGIDDKAPNARRKAPKEAYIKPRSATQLAGQSFEVLLTHDSPRDAIYPGSGSEEISALLALAQPSHHFFGHYSGTGDFVGDDFGASQVFHMSGLELRGPGGTAEEGSVGVLTWRDDRVSFAYVEPAWLWRFTRHNWRNR